MIYLLVDVKIVLALHPSDQTRGWSEGGAYPREGRLSKFEVLWGALNWAGALNGGNTVYILGIHCGNGVNKSFSLFQFCMTQ